MKERLQHDVRVTAGAQRSQETGVMALTARDAICFWREEASKKGACVSNFMVEDETQGRETSKTNEVEGR